MKRVAFIRHAHSSFSSVNSNDHDRELSKEGAEECKIVGKWMKENSYYPDLYISSSAIRAKQTCQNIQSHLNSDENIFIDSQIYHQGIKGVLDNIIKAKESCKFIVIFGHNPSFEDIYNMINNSIYKQFPTCSVVIASFKEYSWNDFSIDKLEFMAYTTPNDLKY